MTKGCAPTAPARCPPPLPAATAHSLLQLQQSSDWLDMVDRAYESLDRDGCGRIGPKDLEELLCGDGGCEVRLLPHGCRLAAACCLCFVAHDLPAARSLCFGGCRLAAARSLCFGSVPALQYLQPVLAELPAALPPPHRRPPTGWTWCFERQMSSTLTSETG